MKYHLSNENELAGGMQCLLFPLYAWLTIDPLPYHLSGNTSQKGKHARVKSKADKIFNGGLNRKHILHNTLQIL